MSLIQCKLGPTETNVGGRVYAFENDRDGRAVCFVDNPDHQACFLAVEHYVKVDPAAPRTPPPAPEEDAEDDTPTQDPAIGSPEPVGIGAETAAEPVAEPPADPPQGDEPAFAGTDIIVIKGIGEKLKAGLAAYGVNTVEDLLKLDAAGLELLDKDLKLHGAIERDKWLEQAQAIVAQGPATE